MYPFIQKCPLADMLSGGAMRHAVWGYVVFVLIGSCVTDKKIGIYLDPFFGEVGIALKMTVFLH